MISILSHSTTSITVNKIGNIETAKVVSSDPSTLSGLNMDDRIFVKSSSDIYELIITELGGNEVKGQIIGRCFNYSEGNKIFEEMFNGVSTTKLNMANEEDIKIKLLIVPYAEDIDKNYSLTKFLQGSSVSNFELSSISIKWDNVMNEPPKVIGHEKVKDEIITSIISGKHILLYGPPGTGKTTIASRISRVFDCESMIFTAHAEWTADDTIGGYTFTIDPTSKQQKIEPTDGFITSAILDCNKKVSDHFYNNIEMKGTWVIVDELNRAKMDFAFGALFTALDPEYSLLKLPQYRNYDSKKQELFIPKTFRLIGTINNYDKNFLFKLSYALSRRFSHVYIGVPDSSEFDNELLLLTEMIIRNLNKEFGLSGVISSGVIGDTGIIKIKDLIAYLRGYTRTEGKIRDIGTALFKDAVKFYLVQRHVVSPHIVGKELYFADISINSIIIPALEGVLTDEQINELDNFTLDLNKTNRSIKGFLNNDY